MGAFHAEIFTGRGYLSATLVKRPRAAQSLSPTGEAVIAAIYARKSTDQNAPDEEKSNARQIAHARAYAQRKGFASMRQPSTVSS